MNQENTYQSFPFQAFENHFKGQYDVARDADRLLIKMTAGNLPYADGRAAVMVELRKWIADRYLESWWSRDMVHSAAMWIAAGAKQIDRSVPIAQHVAAKKPIIVPVRPVDKKVTAPPLQPIPAARLGTQLRSKGNDQS